MTQPIICPNSNCCYHGEPKRRPRGSRIAVFLLLAFTLIASFINLLVTAGLAIVLVIYLIAAAGYSHECPRCGVTIRHRA